MTVPFSINDKGELEAARLSVRMHLNLASKSVQERTHPAFRDIVRYRAEQRWAMIEALIDQQIARIEREVVIVPAGEFPPAPEQYHG